MTWHLIWAIILFACACLVIPNAIKALKSRHQKQDLIINGIRISSNTHANAILNLVLGCFGLIASIIFSLLWLRII